MDPILTYITATAYLGVAVITGFTGRFAIFTLYLASKGAFLLLAWAPDQQTRVIVSEIGFPTFRWIVVLESFSELAYWMNSQTARWALVFLGIFSLNGGVFALVHYPGAPVVAAFRMARQMFCATSALFVIGWLLTCWCAQKRFGAFSRRDLIHFVILAVYIIQFPIEGMVDRIAQLDRDRDLWLINNQASFVVNCLCLASWAWLYVDRQALTARSKAAIRSLFRSIASSS